MDIEKRIAQTDIWGLVAIMHEAFIEETVQAKELMERGASQKQLASLYEHLREILVELTLTFDEKNPISKDLINIYVDATLLLAEGFRRMDSELLDNTVRIIFPLYEAFMEKSEKTPMEDNFSGFTYNKNDLTEGKKYKGLDIKS